MMASGVGGGLQGCQHCETFDQLHIYYLIDFFNKGLVVARISRMSGFNSKFGGGARQLRCQGIHRTSFLHTLISNPSAFTKLLAMNYTHLQTAVARSVGR